MQGLSFDFDWVDAEGIRGPELSATWASLSIRAGDSIVTQVLDRRSKTVRGSVHAPVYPLAEWLAANWWFLTHEFENRTKKDDPSFRRRHRLSAGREGYAFPDLEVVSSGSRIRLVWTQFQPRWTEVSFLDRGQAWIDKDAFRETCSDLIDRVVRRLDSLDIRETFLQKDWAAIQGADRDEAGFCETAAGLGWDPYALEEAERDLVLGLADRLSGMALEEAAAALDPRALHAGCAAIERAIAEAKSNGLVLEGLAPVRGAVGKRRRRAVLDPWDEGYEMARRARRALDLDDAPLPTTAGLAEALGADPDALDRAMKPTDFGAAELVDGVATRDADENPAFAFRGLHDENRRFLLCRALAETLASPASDALLTKARSERQQRGRAFAAEFLAPSRGLRTRVSRPVVDEEDIGVLAAEFGVSPLVVAHQIENHRIARVWPER